MFKLEWRLKVKKSCFPSKVVDVWNGLLEQVMCAASVEFLEGRLDMFLRDQKIVNDYRANVKIAFSGIQISASEYMNLAPEA